jgi:ORF6N domain
MIQLTAPEWAALRPQFVTLKPDHSQHRKYRPYAFTEQGVAMLSSVLRSFALALSHYPVLSSSCFPRCSGGGSPSQTCALVPDGALYQPGSW